MWWLTGNAGLASLTSYDLPYGHGTIEQLAKQDLKQERDRRPLRGCGCLFLATLVAAAILLIVTGQG